MTQKKMTAPVLAHRDGREKEQWMVLTTILSLLRAAVKFAATMLAVYLLAAVAALNIPALIGAMLVLNALLGLWFALEEVPV